MRIAKDLQNEFILAGTSERELVSALREFSSATDFRPVNGEKLRFFQYYDKHDLLLEAVLDPISDGQFGKVVPRAIMDEIFCWETESFIPELTKYGLVIKDEKKWNLVSESCKGDYASAFGLSGRGVRDMNISLAALIKRRAQSKIFTFVVRNFDGVNKLFAIKSDKYIPHIQSEVEKQVRRKYNLKVKEFYITHFKTDIIYELESQRLFDATPLMKLSMSDTNGSTVIEPGWYLHDKRDRREAVWDEKNAFSVDHKKAFNINDVNIRFDCIDNIIFSDEIVTVEDIIKKLPASLTDKTKESLVKETKIRRGNLYDVVVGILNTASRLETIPLAQESELRKRIIYSN